MSLILLWFTCLIKSEGTKPEYLHSIFGAPGKEEVVIDYVDGIEILERNLPKPKLKHIREAHYTDPIEDNDYPWPGHDFNGTATWAALNNETNKVRAEFSRTNLTQEEMYWHPAAAKQYYTTNEVIAEAERVKIRYIISPKYNRHVPPILIPPGEVAKMEISPAAVGKVGVTLNRYMSNIWTLQNGQPKYKQRLIHTRIDNLKLTSTVNGIGMPWGATVNFDMSVNDPIEVNITGVILCPWFTYGVHSDSEWENEMSKLPGPFSPISTGNM
ncbi:Immuno-dominant variable surface antigen-like protein [Tritrichomonas foetus]|uniref:Immuno-dominant variable surface antigen-like protein n=1 Tax=Tritrichomonas foetus TaxID=1144522 RepID=A0A1J4KIJ7_9EUKA|nr:Immuno-dominant variable surface antigen-like protein [Tritrichomonas foetus]|eukprot:OHT11175.1 Immuno-dominant variable surface antigen-like protein [Tritrichomonas foetus]